VFSVFNSSQQRMTITFRPPTLDDAALLLEWRSQSRINDMMFSDVQPHDLNKQRNWLTLCEQRQDYKHFIILGDGQPVGYLSYTGINLDHGHCSCGSYFGSIEAGRKYGGHMHAYFMDYLFYGLGMRKNVVQILGANPRVLKLQHLLGMREVGVLKAHILKNKMPVDVHVFELLKEDWESHRWNTQSIADSLKAFGLEETKCLP
jgi:RimJ/RimL family protein N-acetyltransferase